MLAEVTKYIGDCVMAHFPPDYTDAAIEACLKRSTMFGGFGEWPGSASR